MREILFRGKRADNGEWVEGYVAEHTLISEDLKAYVGMVIEGKPKKAYDNNFCYVVDPSTVGQYTGLTDKNGKKIFEGDILSAEVREYEEIESEFWGKGKRPTGNTIKTAWSVEYKNFNSTTGYRVYGKDRRFNMRLCNGLIRNCKCEVIGNIHDNPELLKGDNDAAR